MSKVYLVSDKAASVFHALMHLNSAVNTVATLLILYLLAKKTPPSMAFYKWFLLNNALSCYLFDFYMTVVYAPFTMFPIVGSCTLGLLEPLGYYGSCMGWMFMHVLLGMCGTSVFAAMLYRFAAIRQKEDLLKRPSCITALGLFQVLCTVPSMFAYSRAITSAEENAEDVRNNYPSIYPFFARHSACSLFTVNTRPQLVAYSATGVGEIFAFLLAFSILATGTFRSLASKRHHFSTKTYALHKTLTMSLVVQLLVPTLMIILPYVTFGLAIVLSPEHSQFISLTTFIVSSSHTTVNTVTIIAFAKPYRDAFMEIWRRIPVLGRLKTKPVVANVSPAQSVQSSSSGYPVAVSRTPIRNQL